MFKTILTVALMTTAMSSQAHAGLFKDDDVENAKAAKITIVEAIQKVSGMHQGVVVKADLDDGRDDKLYFEVEVIENGVEKEFMVDALTGEVHVHEHR